MVLLPLVASRVGVPIIAAGGMADGASMAAAFALGAEGVQMGTRMMASVESPVHENMKLAVVAATETDTLTIDHHNRRPVRVLRTPTTEAFEHKSEGDPMALLGSTINLYRDGTMEGTLPQCGQVAGASRGAAGGRDHPPHGGRVRSGGAGMAERYLAVEPIS